MSATGTPRPRDVGVDVLRIVAICLVVVAHVWTRNEVLHAAAYIWHVPVFFFLSGYFASRDRSFAAEVRSRARSLGLPYVSWLVLITAAVVLLALPSGPVSPPWAALLWGGSGLGRPYSTMWFVSALLVVAIAYRLVARLPLWARFAIALVLYVVALVVPAAVRSLPLALGVGLACLVFVVAGAALREHGDRIRHRVVTSAVALAVGALLVAVGAARPLDLKQADFGTPVVSLVVSIAVCASLTLLAEAAFRRAGPALSVTTSWFARAGLIVVLVHPLFLYVLSTPPEGSLRDALITLAGSWTLGLLIVLTPAARVLGGVDRVRLPDRRTGAR